jgi:hypothetical protein
MNGDREHIRETLYLKNDEGNHVSGKSMQTDK